MPANQQHKNTVAATASARPPLTRLHDKKPALAQVAAATRQQRHQRQHDHAQQHGCNWILLLLA